MLRQSFETTGVAPSRASAAVRFSIGGGVSLPLGAGFSVTAESAAESYLFELRTSSGTSFTPSVAFRQRIGLSKEL